MLSFLAIGIIFALKNYAAGLMMVFGQRKEKKNETSKLEPFFIWFYGFSFVIYRVCKVLQWKCTLVLNLALSLCWHTNQFRGRKKPLKNRSSSLLNLASITACCSQALDPVFKCWPSLSVHCPLCPLLHNALAFISHAPKSSGAPSYHSTQHWPHCIISVALLLSLLRQTVKSSRSGPCLIYLYLLSHASLGIWQSSISLAWMNRYMDGPFS